MRECTWENEEKIISAYLNRPKGIHDFLYVRVWNWYTIITGVGLSECTGRPNCVYMFVCLCKCEIL